MLVAHSVLWLCSALAERRPLALVVDDAQWADRSSLEVLSYLARRIDDLPLLIAVGARADDPRAPSDLLGLLGGVRSATVLHPQPLTPRGAARLIRRLAPDTPAPVCRDCHRAVGGNPWLLGELGRQIAAHGPEAIDAGRRRRAAGLGDRAQRHAPAAGRRWPRATGRSPRRSPSSATARRAHVVAAVAGVAVGELAPARDALLAAGLLGPDGERFAHGLIADRDRARTSADRARAPAPRGGARADGRPAPTPTSSPATCCSARPQGDAGGQRAAACGPRRPRRGAGRRTPRRPTSSARSRSARRATTAARCSRSWPRWPSTPACRTRSGACSTRCPRCAIARAASTCSRAWPRSTSSTPATPTSPRSSSRSSRARRDPDARLAVEAASLDALMMIPERHAERARRVNAHRPHARPPIRCSSA